MIVDAEKRGTKPEALSEMIGEGRSALACIEGDCEDGSLYCGQIGGAVQELKSAGDQRVSGGHGCCFCTRGVNFRPQALQKRIRRAPMVAVCLYPFDIDSVDPQ